MERPLNAWGDEEGIVELPTYSKNIVRVPVGFGRSSRDVDRTQTTTPAASQVQDSRGSPHLPGAAQHLQRRETQHDSAPKSADRGTQHAPLEISSSPELEAKRRKIAPVPQAPRQTQENAPKPTGPVNCDGVSRQALTRMLAESTDVKPRKQRYYAVACGRKPGIYNDWPSAEQQVKGFPGARHKKFKSYDAASSYFKGSLNVPESAMCFCHTSICDYCVSSEREALSAPLLATGSTPSPRALQPKNLPSPINLELELRPDFTLPQNDVDPVLVPEQQKVVDLILQGHNVFYTGSAGCGKSTILKAFVKQLTLKKRRVKIIAPTNLAALNVGGQTTWNFAGWTPDSMKKNLDELMKGAQGKEVFKRLTSVDVLVIDEISMIENLQFERLNMLMKHARGRGAFGGVQIIVTGDVSHKSPLKTSVPNVHSSVNFHP